MSQNYNINMKKFNGTDYDGLLPLAYNALNSQQLDGKTFNEIQNLFTSVDLQMYSGQYTGTGTYGSSNPVTITFPFATSIVFIPFAGTSRLNQEVPRPLYAAQLSTTSWTNVASSNARNLYAKVSQDNKTYYWYADYNRSQSEAYNNAYNISGVTYYYVGFGNYDAGGQTEWILTESQTFTVPRTGKYYIELYGGGGGARSLRDSSTSTYPSAYLTGRSSCQSYDSINLTINQQIIVVIRTGGTSRQQGASTDGGATSFGTYTVQGRKKSYVEIKTVGNVGNYNFVIGEATGNKRTGGTGTGSQESTNNNPNNGTYGSKYGYGGHINTVGYSSNHTSANGGPRAVYLKYLGA